MSLIEVLLTSMNRWLPFLTSLALSTCPTPAVDPAYNPIILHLTPPAVQRPAVDNSLCSFLKGPVDINHANIEGSVSDPEHEP